MFVSGSIILFLFITRNRCLANKTYFSKWIKTESDYTSKIYIFETLLSVGLDKCKEHCKATKMCRYINFDVKADACFLIGVGSISDVSPDDEIDTKAGFILGKKEDWNMEKFAVCNECDPYGACKKDGQAADKYTICQSSGCGPPENKPFTVVFGNMFSVGRKMQYQCQDGFTDVSGETGIATCQNSGNWTSSSIRCLPDGAATTCFDNSCYLLDSTPRTWQNGKDNCEKLGGHLAYIKTQGVYSYIKQHIFSTVKSIVWLGATDEETEGTFIWSDGTPLNDGYFNWDDNEPSSVSHENCLVYASFLHDKWLHKWHDVGCSRNYSSLCEF